MHAFQLISILPEAVVLPVVLYALRNPPRNIVVVVVLALYIAHLLPAPLTVPSQKTKKSHRITPLYQTYYTIKGQLKVMRLHAERWKLKLFSVERPHRQTHCARRNKQDYHQRVRGVQVIGWV